VRLSPELNGGLRVDGLVDPAEINQLKELKAEILEYLRDGPKIQEVDWVAMRRLAENLGKPVETGEPWGTGTLWGISPHGAAVCVGPVIVTFDFSAISPVN
jgi:hypothetical protein